MRRIGLQFQQNSNLCFVVIVYSMFLRGSVLIGYNIFCISVGERGVFL